MDSGEQPHSGVQDHGVVDVDLGGILHPHPVAHPTEIDALPHRGVGCCQLVMGVDPQGLAVVGDAEPRHRSQQGDHIGEVLLLLGVVPAQPGQGVGQAGTVEHVGGHRHLGDRPGGGVGVLLLDDCGDPAGTVPDHPAVAGGIRDHGGEHRRRAAMRRHQGGDGGRGEQRSVSGDDQNLIARHRTHGLQGSAGGVAGAARFGLNDRAHSVGQHCGNAIRIGRDHHRDVGDAGGAHRSHHPVDDRPTGHRVQHLGKVALHPGPPTGGEDDRPDAHRWHSSVAGGIGLEPILRGPKPRVLPLHHPPLGRLSVGRVRFPIPDARYPIPDTRCRMPETATGSSPVVRHPSTGLATGDW